MVDSFALFSRMYYMIWWAALCLSFFAPPPPPPSPSSSHQSILSPLPTFPLVSASYPTNSNELKASGSKIAFSTFDVSLRITNLPLPSTVSADHCRQFIAREPGRADINPETLRFSYESETSIRRSHLSNGQGFAGQLAYAKVFA
jgi:hypothetical protein